MSRRLKGRMYMTLVRGILLYGANTWTTYASDLQDLETFDMACIRRIARVSRMQRIRSEEIRAQMGIDCSIGECVKRERIRYFGHLMRMDDSAHLKRVMSLSVLSTTPLGGSLKTWAKCLKDDIESRGFGVYTASKLAEDSKDEFRSKVVYGLAPPS